MGSLWVFIHCDAEHRKLIQFFKMEIVFVQESMPGCSNMNLSLEAENGEL